MATTSDYLNQLQIDKQNFITKFSDKGVDVTGNETFTELVPKFDDIQSGISVERTFDEETIQKGSISTPIVGSYVKLLKNIPTLNLTFGSSVYQYFLYYSGDTIDGSQYDTTNITNMQGMFQHCQQLINLDVSNFDTSKVTNMSYMFYNCSSLTELDVSNFDTSKVTNMSSMFYDCSQLKNLKIKLINTSLDVSSCPLTAESISYILQNLGSNVENKTLTLGSTNLAKATEEDLASATAKGWIVN